MARCASLPVLQTRLASALVLSGGLGLGCQLLCCVLHTLCLRHMLAFLRQMARHVKLAQEAWKPVSNPESAIDNSKSKDKLNADTKPTGNRIGAMNMIKIKPKGYGRGYGSLVTVKSGVNGKDRVSRLADASNGNVDAIETMSPGVFELNKRLSIRKSDRTPSLANDKDETPSSPVLMLQNEPSAPEKNELEQSPLKLGNIPTPDTNKRNLFINKDKSTAEEKIQTSDNEDTPSNNVEPPVCEECPTISDAYINEGYTIQPAMAELRKMTKEQLENVVGFAVKREGYGEVKWLGKVNICGLVIHEVVEISEQNIEVYKNGVGTPERGTGLNKPAICTIEHVEEFPGFGEPEQSFTDYLEAVTVDMDASFINYDEEAKVWVFKVKHFTKYGLNNTTQTPKKPPSTSMDMEEEQEMDTGAENIAKDLM